MSRRNETLASVVLVAVLVAAVFGVFYGIWFGWGAMTRYQSRADRSQNREQARFDAANQVQVNNIRIGYFRQQEKIAEQQAAIRYAQAVGIRRAQDEISRTLTPLYVQFEMVDAMRQIASSGRNNTTVFIPSGPGGVPLVQGLGPAVGAK